MSFIPQATDLIKFTTAITLHAKPPADEPEEPENTQHQGPNHQNFNALEKNKDNTYILDLLEILEIEQGILKYINPKDALNFQLVNKKFRGSYLTHLQPRISDKNKNINGQNIKAGEFYFPEVLSNKLISKNILERAKGLEFINIPLQKRLSESENILKSDLTKSISDLDGFFINIGLILHRNLRNIADNIHYNYKTIFPVVWNWENISTDLLKFPSNIQNLLTMEHNLENSSDLPFKQNSNFSQLKNNFERCVEDVEALERLNARPFSTKLYDACILLSSSVAVIFMTLSIIYLCAVLESILTSTIILQIISFTISFIIGGIVGLYIDLYAALWISLFIRYYRLPRTLDQLTTKLKDIENLFHIKNAKHPIKEHSIENPLIEKYPTSSIAIDRQAYLASNLSLLLIPESTVEEPEESEAFKIRLSLEEQNAAFLSTAQQPLGRQKLALIQENIRILLNKEFLFHDAVREKFIQPSLLSRLQQNIKKVFLPRISPA